MMEMEKALSDQDTSDSPEHKRHMAVSLGCTTLNCSIEAESKHNVLFKIWIQHVASKLQDE